MRFGSTHGGVYDFFAFVILSGENIPAGCFAVELFKICNQLRILKSQNAKAFWGSTIWRVLLRPRSCLRHLRCK